MLHAQACLFMCEADNVCYAIGLGEKVRARVEAAGRIELAEHDRAQLVQTKAAFTVALFLAIPIFVAAQPMATAPTLMSTDLFFLAGGVGAALLAGGSPLEILAGTGKAFGAWFLGLIFRMFIFFIS